MRRVLFPFALGLAMGLALVLIAIIAYTVSLKPCPDHLPYVHPLPIDSVGPLYVQTDHGRLFPGQTYRYRNEGPWVGDHTLLLVFAGRATLITRYPIQHPTYHRAACRAVYP